MMPLPEFVAQQVEKLLSAYCEKRVPPPVRGQIRLEYQKRGNRVTLVERRPVWNDPSAEWTERPIVRFDYHSDDGHWTLNCADRNGRWHRYDEVEPTRRFEDLLEALEKDVTGTFWG